MEMSYVFADIGYIC